MNAGVDEVTITSIISNPTNLTASGLPPTVIDEALAAYAQGFQKGFLVNGAITLVVSVAVVLLISPRRLPKKEEEVHDEAAKKYKEQEVHS